MFDHGTQSLTTVLAEAHSEYVSRIESGATFDELVTLTYDLRARFPEVRMSGPYLQTSGDVTVDLTHAGETVELRVRASQSIITHNNTVGW